MPGHYTPPQVAGGGGGAGLVGDAAQVGGDPVAVGVDLQPYLPWAINGGDELFDLTDPTKPLALVGGIYACSVGAYLDGNAVAGKIAAIQLELDADDVDASCTVDMALSLNFATHMASLTFPVPEGGAFRLSVRHNHSAELSFALTGTAVLLG